MVIGKESASYSPESPLVCARCMLPSSSMLTPYLQLGLTGGPLERSTGEPRAVPEVDVCVWGCVECVELSFDKQLAIGSLPHSSSAALWMSLACLVICRCLTTKSMLEDRPVQ